jgi:hypothetical protein
MGSNERAISDDKLQLVSNTIYRLGPLALRASGPEEEVRWSI